MYGRLHKEDPEDILKCWQVHVDCQTLSAPKKAFMTREDNGLLVNAVAAHVAGEQSRKALFLILKVLYLKDFERSMPRDTQF